MRRVALPWLAGPVGLLLLPAAPLAAQCDFDLVEAGIQAYRDLNLEAAADLLNGAVSGNASTSCSTTDARALTYLGAAHWLEERPDAAVDAFRQAVIRAPRFQPDAYEFPPEVTELFDEIRRATPSVAATLPDEVEIGPGAEEALFIRLAASTDHTVAVTLRSDGLPVQMVYRGPVAGGPRGTLVEWDGRGLEGELVESGFYDLEIVSLDEEARPLRKLVIVFAVASDAPAGAGTEPARARPAADTATALVADELPAQITRSRQPSVWKAVAVGGVALLAAGLVVAGPELVGATEASWARYPVAGAIGVAGIIGVVRHLRGGRPDVPFRGDVDLARASPEPSAPPEAAPREPTLRIRPGYQRRVELQYVTVERGPRPPGEGGAGGIR